MSTGLPAPGARPPPRARANGGTTFPHPPWVRSSRTPSPPSCRRERCGGLRHPEILGPARVSDAMLFEKPCPRGAANAVVTAHGVEQGAAACRRADLLGKEGIQGEA